MADTETLEAARLSLHFLLSNVPDSSVVALRAAVATSRIDGNVYITEGSTHFPEELDPAEVRGCIYGHLALAEQIPANTLKKRVIDEGQRAGIDPLSLFDAEAYVAPVRSGQTGGELTYLLAWIDEYLP